MEKLKAYGSIFLGMTSCFNLGIYTMCVRTGFKVIEPHQWIMTSMFGLFFIILGIDSIRKLNK